MQNSTQYSASIASADLHMHLPSDSLKVIYAASVSCAFSIFTNSSDPHRVIVCASMKFIVKGVVIITVNLVNLLFIVLSFQVR